MKKLLAVSRHHPWGAQHEQSRDADQIGTQKKQAPEKAPVS
ncbi:hypothetical protein [Pseudomonas bananamidigenes]|nr:hypothetical protein [Pseudomonas bananamidigenes]